jgi:hypothetical protein
MSNDVDVVLPVAGTLPTPVHPVHTYWIPEDPATGEVTEAETAAPESYQRLAGDGEP